MPTSPWQRSRGGRRSDERDRRAGADEPAPLDRGTPGAPAHRARARARGSVGRPPLAAQSRAFLARAPGCEPQRRPRVRHRRRRPPARRRSRPSRLARLPGGRCLPRAPRARDPGRAPRDVEPRVRDLHADRARARGRACGGVRARPRPPRRSARPPDLEVGRARADRDDRGVDDRRPRLDARARGRDRPRTPLRAARRALDPRDRALRLRRRSLPDPLPRARLEAPALLRRRLHSARRGDDRRRPLAELAGLLVGVARADARRLRADRDRRPSRMARGALRGALPGAGRERGDRPLRRPQGVHRASRSSTAATR